MSTDRILAIVSLLGVFAFLSPILIMVGEPDLLIVIIVVLIMAAYDFWLQLWKRTPPQ